VIRAIPLEGVVHQSYLRRLCEEIDRNLRENTDTGVFTFLYRYFQTLLQQRRLEELEVLIEALESHTFTVHTNRVHAFVNYVKAYLRKSQGNLKESAHWFRETLVKHDELQQIGMENVEVDCYKELGNLEFHQKLYKCAIDKYQSAINRLQLNEDSRYMLAIVMYNMALCQYKLKNYHQTLEYLNKVIPLAKDTSNSYLLLDTLILKSALLSEHFRHYAEANKILDQAYEIAQRNQHSSVMNIIWNNWGHNFFHLKQYVLAEQALQHSIRLSHESNDLEAELHSGLLLAEIWVAQGREAEAKQLLERAVENASHNRQYTKELLDCLELLGQLETDESLRLKYLEDAYQLALKLKKHQKSTKIKKNLT
jgi:tetratricopeptide (TPR) repeat protein